MANFPTVTTTELAGAAGIGVQAGSVRSLTEVTSAEEISIEVHSWGPSSTHLKATLKVEWDDGDTLNAQFDMNFSQGKPGVVVEGGEIRSITTLSGGTYRAFLAAGHPDIQKSNRYQSSAGRGRLLRGGVFIMCIILTGL